MNPHDEPLDRLQERAFREARQRHGAVFRVHVPGMFCMDGVRGRYPAISVTGHHCGLQCDHCRGRLLETLPFETTPVGLIARCRRLDEAGFPGILLTGGCDREGHLPWPRFVDAIDAIHRSTHLYISFHAGFIEPETALRMKQAGVNQALIDVVGSDVTVRRVFHLDGGIAAIRGSLRALAQAGIDIVPHIILGLDGPEIRSEYDALETIASEACPAALAVVVRMPLARTPLQQLTAPLPSDVGRFLATARLRFPNTVLTLGCARPRHIEEYERVAVDSGVNRIALASESTIEYARGRGLDIHQELVCCSVPDPHLHREDQRND